MFLKKSKDLNYNDRPLGVDPYMILLHYTGMESMEAAKDRLSDPQSPVSAHYLVDEDGRVFDLVSEDKRAWHAGLSYWRGETDINSASIGVEIVNPGHEHGYRSFPDVQMRSVLTLCQEIQGRHSIDCVLAHSDVAPERKIDPGELFDWRYFADHGVGLWPNPTDEHLEEAKVVSKNDFEAEKLFVKYGYNPMTAYVDIVSAFHRHYYQERFEEGCETQINTQTIARLLYLIEQQEL